MPISAMKREWVYSGSPNAVRCVWLWLDQRPYTAKRWSEYSNYPWPALFFRSAVMNLYQLAQEMGKIHGSSGISQFYHSLAGQRFKCNEQAGHAAAAIFIILPLWISGLWRNASLLNKLSVRLIQPDHRAQRIIRTLIYIQNVLHPRYKLCPGFGMHHSFFCQGLSSFFQCFHYRCV